ncbi:hypothetical protein LN650_17880 [Klebsiella pneumoniae subsp. pneumoniae]|nr:hypothetical protein [Klebsiella pneumoniae subsp. pneumoniae]
MSSRSGSVRSCRLPVAVRLIEGGSCASRRGQRGVGGHQLALGLERCPDGG